MSTPQPAGIAGAVGALDEDRDRSPLTGWTRDHHRLVADRSLLALRRWASPGHAQFALPGPASNAGPVSDGLEAFARSFLTAGFLLGSGDDDPHDHAGFYAAGLAAGPDGSATDRWPRLDETRQARVEAAALVIALHESRSRIWDRLDAAMQERLVDWLGGSIGTPYGDNNWRWFQNVTQAFLRSVGGPWDQNEVESNLDWLDACYLGDGWYSDGRPDGRGGNVDWYNAWVMHLFSLWYCRILGDQAPADRLAVYRERLAAFLPQGVRLFGASGAPLFQGRSLVYRFATTGLFGAAPVFLTDSAGVEPGALRRVCSGALRWFVEQGAYGADDLLSLGWRGRFEPMRQGYSGPGSPYWASLGFAGLLLGGDHRFWTDTETEPADGVASARPVGWLVGHHHGLVRVVNHGVDHSGSAPLVEDPQYCRFGYSDLAAPVPLAVGATAPVDNQVVVADKRGRWSHRRPLDLVRIDDVTAVSRHWARWTDDGEGWDEGPELITGSVLRDGVEVRAVRVAGQTGGALAISGFALPEDSTLTSAVIPLTAGLAVRSAVHEVANPYGESLVVPYVITDAGAGDQVHVAAVVLDQGDAEAALPSVVVEAAVVTVRWPDGRTHRLDLG